MQHMQQSAAETWALTAVPSKPQEPGRPRKAWEAFAKDFSATTAETFARTLSRVSW